MLANAISIKEYVYLVYAQTALDSDKWIDISINLQKDIFLFAIEDYNNSEMINFIIDRYEFNFECFETPYTVIAVGNKSVGYELETRYNESQTIEYRSNISDLISFNKTRMIENGNIDIRINKNGIQDDYFYNITVTAPIQVSTHSAGSVSVEFGVYIDGILSSDKRFNPDSRVLLEVSLGRNGTSDDAIYVWYESTEQLDIYQLDFITPYQNYLVIDGTKDYDFVLKENAQYSFQVFFFSKLSVFKLAIREYIIFLIKKNTLIFGCIIFVQLSNCDHKLNVHFYI